MGWAKYFEDNISIYNNRMAFEEPYQLAVKEYYSVKKPTLKLQSSAAVGKKKGYRFGIMLLFGTPVENSIARRLQMNGWWFSKANNCWCNYNNQTNRKYAQQLSTSLTAKITFIV